jgi:Chitobiase/beta-hexosaminidase C-terminal domain/Legume lectin domain/Fn3 associated
VSNPRVLGAAIRSAVSIFPLLAAISTAGQNVTTHHNDIARTGANTSEKILTPANVSASTFGKLFYYVVDGYVYAQPLYVAGVTMGAAGTSQPGTRHNVVFVATEHDSVYAFDADSNLNANGKPLWHITLLDAAHGAAAGATPELSSDFGYTDIVPEVGITSTPVIDTSTNTIYVVGKTKESGKYFYKLHALDITTGAEKFGGPVDISGSVPGNGSGSSAGTLSFDPTFQLQRPGLLLLHGVVYIAFGATYDVTPSWHGWIFGYSASTLHRTGVWSASPNGNGSSIWLGGAGLAADVIDPTGHPYGRLFTATGNGSFNATTPYNNTMSYSISVLRLDLANGAPTMTANGVQVGDMFAPFDQAHLDSIDDDQGSGGVLLLPDAVSGGKHLMVQVGKSGRIYILDRNNLGGFHPTNTSDPQQKAGVGALFGLPAYWNGHLYFWPASAGGALKAFSFSNGVLSSSPTSVSAEISSFPGATPSVSSNGNSNAIVWTVRTDAFGSRGPAILYAHDATNLAKLLYSSSQDAPRDTPGPAVKFVTPTITNGKVYVGTENQLAVFGLLNGATQAAAPVISPIGRQFHPSIQITITDSTPNAKIFYTTDGTTPSTASTLYTAPFTISTSSTVKAIAAGSGLLASTVSSETYTLINQVPTPSFSPVPGDYTSAQSVTITTTAPNSTIYYTTNGSTPTTSSSRYTGPISISSTTTLKAMAVSSGLTNSYIASGVYTIAANATSSINFSRGFTSTGITRVGRAVLSGTRLRLTDGGSIEAGAAWFNTQVNVQSFSTDFMFQQVPGTSPEADGLTFTIQRHGLTAIGPYGGLGYGPPTPTSGTIGIPTSVAVKFDLFSGAGEGNNSTGLYKNGASPTIPAVTLGGGVNLHTGDVFAVHITYNGATLTMTITDTTNSSETFTTSWSINIPSTIGGNTAFVGFTAGTGHYTAVQDILNWTFLSTSGSGTPPPAATPVISPATGTYTSPQTVTVTDSTSGSSIFYTLNGAQPTSSSTKYTAPFTVSATTTVKAIATASGFSASKTATSVITIQSGGGGSPTINFASGFTSTGLQFNGHAKLNGTRLQLTDGGSQEASSSWFTTPVNVQSFTTDFSFQFINANSDGMTFTIQNAGLTALGLSGGALAYGAPLPGGAPGIPKSVAVKFDLFQNVHEGTNSTGLYTDGASPTSPSVTIGSGVNLHSGDPFRVHITYNGATLTMTITDTTTNAAFTTSWPIDIPATVGANTALVGFTGSTGVSTTTQVINWTYGP